MDTPFVFISYSSKDKHIADAVCHFLEENNIACWIAPRDILPGQKWAGAIVKAIKESQAMVLVYSTNSNDSDQVANEVDKAFSNSKAIIPFMVDSTPLNEEFEYYLSRKHWLVAYPNYRDMLEELLKAVKKNCPVCGQYFKKINEPTSQEVAKWVMVGNKYHSERNYIEAEKWYCKAAEQGNREAQNVLGYYYQYGIGDVKIDLPKSFKWYLKAAEQGHPVSQYKLGMLYKFGDGVSKNYTEALKWFSKVIAQERNDSLYNIEIKYDAMYRMAIIYKYGLGVDKDMAEAIRWYRKAAEYGHKYAQESLMELKQV